MVALTKYTYTYQKRKNTYGKNPSFHFEIAWKFENMHNLCSLEINWNSDIMHTHCGLLIHKNGPYAYLKSMPTALITIKVNHYQPSLIGDKRTGLRPSWVHQMRVITYFSK